jgi:transcriptional regulator with GAF, ATPase, and Fis domain
MMNKKLELKEILTSQLESLAAKLGADFSALAFYDPINLQFRWRLAIGSLSNRYTGIVVRGGRGICGRVLKTKREFTITHFPEDVQDEFLEFPILIIEELKSAAAVPLFFQTELIGVLLIGQRDCRKFKHAEKEYMKAAADEIVHFYTQNRKMGKKVVEEKKEIEKSALFHFFAQEKTRWGENLEIILLDQRITLLSEKVQQGLISIFEFLLECAFLKESISTVKVLIELKSEQQFTIQFETNTHIELSEEVFSRLADDVGTLKGSIDMIYDHRKTILTMNFFLSMLISDQIWI